MSAAIWDKLAKKQQEGGEGSQAASVSKKPKAKEVKGKSEKKSKKAKADMQKAELFNQILVRPVISENAMNHQAIGKYIFEVSQRSNKPQIAKAIKALYGVHVEAVNIINCKPKNANFRMKKGRKSGIKKAIVSLAKGESIELFKEAK